MGLEWCPEWALLCFRLSSGLGLDLSGSELGDVPLPIMLPRDDVMAMQVA